MPKFYYKNIISGIDPTGEPKGPFKSIPEAIKHAQMMLELGAIDILRKDLPVIISVEDNGVPLIIPIDPGDLKILPSV